MKGIRKLLKILLITIIIIPLICGGLFAMAFWVEPHRVTTKDISYTSSKITKDTKVAIFADTHFSANYTIEDFKKAVDKINEEKPDLILFLGDLIDNYSTNPVSVDSISHALSSLKAPKGKYAVFGNHDYGGGAEFHYENIMKKGGFEVLINDGKLIPDTNIRLFGLDDFLLGNHDPAYVSNLPEYNYNLVICHEPDILDEIANSASNLYLSGHSHGGQVKIPFMEHNFFPTLGKKYTYGSYKVNNIDSYVNPGLGTTRIAARLFVPPEVTFITLKK